MNTQVSLNKKRGKKKKAIQSATGLQMGIAKTDPRLQTCTPTMNRQIGVSHYQKRYNIGLAFVGI
jgi:hypothetical protein